MFDKLKGFFVNTIQQELQKLGYSIDQETVDRALSNAPHLAQQIQSIWASNDPNKLTEIYNLIINAAQNDTTTPSKKHTETERK